MGAQGDKSVCVTYLLWLVGGWLGLHHFYLRRDIQAFLYWCLPGGYFGAGWFRDLWRIPAYVREANNSAEEKRRFKELVRQRERPPFSFARCAGQLVVGNIFGLIVVLATPLAKEIGVDLTFWSRVILSPAATAIGVWLVGNIGRQKGSLFYPLIACFLTTPLHYWGFTNNTLCCIAGIIAFQWKSKQWRHKEVPPMSMSKRITILVMCGGLYTSLWGSYLYFNMRIVTKDGDEIPLRDAVRHFLQSPAVQEFSRNVAALWKHAWEHGFWSTWKELVDSLDPLGEKSALKILDLKSGSSQEEIKSRYRELTKKWHPDRFQNEEEKNNAHLKFVDIQQAYERLSDIKARRIRRSKVSDTSKTREDL